ncbi:PAS domain S-box protein [Aerosakkonema funiforme]|uniref:PAS domain S-box protein n=1 Tax=Aerosakkonema funiforme TaxID=1246630 RepID=UPI0035BA5D61
MPKFSIVKKLLTRRLTPLKIAALYVVVGGVWILFSDGLVFTLVKNSHLLAELQTLKGWFYVFVTAGMLYALIKQSMAALELSEAALRSSEERFRQLAENIDEVFWLKPPQLNEILYVSPAYEQIWGKSRQSLYQQPMSWTDAIHPDDRDRVIAGIEKFLVGKADFNIKYRIVRPDGEVRWIRDRAFPIDDKAGITYRIAGVAQDVTERQELILKLQKLNEELENKVEERTSELKQTLKQLGVEIADRQKAEATLQAAYRDLEMQVEQRTLYLSQANAALQESQEKLQAILDNTTAAIYVKDIAGHFLTINRHLERLFNITRDRIVGKTDYDILPKDLAERIRDNDRQVMETGEPIQFEEEVFQQDGWHTYISAKFPLYDATGLVYAIGGTSTDITDRKQAQLELQSSEERFRRAILEAPLPIIIHAEDGEILQINRTWTELTGYTHSDIPTIADWLEKAYGSRKESVKADIDVLYKLNKPIVEGEYTIATRSGETRIWEFHSAHLGTLYDGRNLVISTGIDITERKKAEAEIHELNETLEQRVAERTAQLEQANQDLEAFAYSIAHDLRAPLRGMHGLAEALLEDYGDKLDDLGQEYARHIVNSAHHLDDLINDLLDYSRLSRTELNLGAVDLNTVVSEAIAQLKTDLEKSQAQVTAMPSMPKVQAHRNTLAQAIVNLLSNAIKFVDKDSQPQVHIWTETDDECVKLWVADDGIGIAPEHQKRIFRVFERLHGIESYPGTGIGLAIVQKAVERMGGSVGVESELGKGSKFWIKLRNDTTKEG